MDEIMGDPAPLASIVNGELRTPRLLLIDSGAVSSTSARRIPIRAASWSRSSTSRAPPWLMVHFETANG
eukprot:12950786-Heterocapsa_arctica.AAC.1